MDDEATDDIPRGGKETHSVGRANLQPRGRLDVGAPRLPAPCCRFAPSRRGRLRIDTRHDEFTNILLEFYRCMHCKETARPEYILE